MKTKLMSLALLLGGAMAISSCATSKDSIKAVEAQHYFVNNTAPTNVLVKATSQSELERYFGYATVMGKDGKPTEIDFSKQMVIAKILPSTNRYTETSSPKVSVTGKNELTLSYTITRGQEMSYSMTPMVMMIISKQYAGYTIKENITTIDK